MPLMGERTYLFRVRLFRQTTPPSSAINESAFKQIILGLLLFSGLCLVIEKGSSWKGVSDFGLIII
jgi:hypothetical protein